MGPKKRSRQAAKKGSTSSKPAGAKKRKVRGLLGLQGGYNSESDDDYEPQARSAKKPSPTKARGKGRGRGRRASSPTPSTSSDSDSSDVDSREMECSYASSDSSDSSGSEETLAARQQRRLSTTPAQPAKARGRGRRARAADRPTIITTWDQLPTAVLAQIFLSVCKHGALPMAPRLACVCTSFNAAVAATPELWCLIDTAAIPNGSWVQAPGGARSPPGKSKGAAAAKGKQKQPAGGRKGASTQLTAEQGLSQWVTSGRLQQLQTVLVYGEGAAGAGCADPQEAAAGDANRQLSAPLLMQIADSCQQLRRVDLFGAWSLRPEEVSSALLSMPALSELWLCGVRFPALTGLTSCLCSVLEAAAVSGYPKLRELVVDGCNSLGQKVVSALCPALDAPQPAGQHADAAAAGQAQHADQAAAGEGTSGAMPAAQPRGPAFPRLEVVDLSHSAGLMGRPFKLLLDEMQAAMPNLRVLKLTGLGGLYGWQVGVRDPASLPGFPALESLHVGCALSAPLSGKMALHAGTSYVNNTVLLQLAGKSPKLHALDLSGCLVNADGLRELAAAHAACRPAADASTAAPVGTDAADADTAADDDADPASDSDSDAGSVGNNRVARAANFTDGMTPEELAALARYDAMCLTRRGALRLRDLQLDGSALARDAGLVAVADCCSETLEQLVVRNAGARLGDDGISSLGRCKKLSTLDIAGCSVTEEGLSDLLSELPAGMLEELHLESCRSLSRGARQAAARGVQQLQEYLANRDA